MMSELLFPENKYRAVLFDLDGLIAETESLHEKAYDFLSEKFGIRLTPEYIDTMVGLPVEVNVRRIMQDFCIPEENFNKILALRFESFERIVKIMPIYPMDGIPEFLVKIKEKGIKTALVTSSIKAHAILIMENISRHSCVKGSIVEFFDVMVFGDDLTRYKPAPDIYIEAINRLGLKPMYCLALEDSQAGVESAKKAGADVVAVPNTYTKDQNFSKADLVISSVKELLVYDFF